MIVVAYSKHTWVKGRDEYPPNQLTLLNHLETGVETAASASDTHAALTEAHGATGAVVGTTNSQTLTNKTISGASNTLSSIDKTSITNTAATLSDTQTLTNKTMSGTSNTFSNIPASAMKSEAWTSYTPTVTAGAGTFTSVSATGRYCRIGKTVWFHYDVTITTNGTAASYVIVTLPVSSYGFAHGVGREVNVVGYMHTAEARGSAVWLSRYDNAYPGGSGYRLVGSITYDVA